MENSFFANLSVNNPVNFFFIGRSGCGKGTQAKFLIEDLKKSDQDRNIFYVETGDKFRSFINNETHTSKISKELMDDSRTQPTFLAVWLWADFMIKTLAGNEHLLFDGTPRSLIEAQALDGAREFYNWSAPIVIYLNVSREWATERLLGRGRADDRRVGDIDARLDWFDSTVVPAIDYYRNNSNYRFLEINGEQTPEEVYQEILNSLQSL